MLLHGLFSHWDKLVEQAEVRQQSQQWLRNICKEQSWFRHFYFTSFILENMFYSKKSSETLVIYFAKNPQ